MNNVRVARVVVDSALPHLDREFDYSVPSKLVADVHVGSRVRVPFAGRLLSAVVVALPDQAAPGVNLAAIRSAASFPSFTGGGIELARNVARRYGSSLWDVLRLMAPPRVATLERREWSAAANPESAERLAGAAASLQDPGSPHAQSAKRCVWLAAPTSDRAVIPASDLVAMAVEGLQSGDQREELPPSALVIAPDARALAALDAAATAAGLRRWTTRAPGDFVVLDHDDGPTARYAAYLAAMTGQARLVFGTRATVLQPVPRLGFIAVWDEASDALADPHSPYFHARTVAAMRSVDEDARLVLGAFAPGVDAAALVSHGFAQLVSDGREEAKAAAPLMEILDDARREREGAAGRHWMPSSVWTSLVAAATEQPVAILVPRAGYISALACSSCGTWASCVHCEGELMLPSAGSDPTCRDCGREHEHWHCAECHGSQLSMSRQGVEAIAEQLKRMAPALQVHLSSGATGVIPDGAVSSGITVATPAALPAVVGGYARLAIVGAHSLGPGGLGAELVAMRWWLNAAALVRSRSEGGVVFVIGNLLPQVRQALLSWDPWTAAVGAYEERVALGLPPSRRAIELTGDPRAIEAALSASLPSPPGVRIDNNPSISVVARDDGATILAARGVAQDVVDAVRAVVAERSRAGATPLRMRVDVALR